MSLHERHSMPRTRIATRILGMLVLLFMAYWNLANALAIRDGRHIPDVQANPTVEAESWIAVVLCGLVLLGTCMRLADGTRPSRTLLWLGGAVSFSWAFLVGMHTASLGT